ncbi:MAG: hypothetical protein OEN55_15845 [Alphaproteobacteria bacterium]|nr:hypothetical protein [Alphaproteobacteria bacterium]
MPQWYDDIAAALSTHGLMARGAFHPGPADGAPAGAGTVLLAGNAGPAMWEAFAAEMPAGHDPLDAWCGAVLEDIAQRFEATALLPSDGPPYLPFQRWAMRAEDVYRSPLGILIDPRFGLWHGYRGALAFPGRLAPPPRAARANPCETCAGRPCLSACPVAAFGEDGYDVPACATHLRTPAGADCMALGCRARRACPVGRDHVYGAAQAAFHMRAFLAARG